MAGAESMMAEAESMMAGTINVTSGDISTTTTAIAAVCFLVAAWLLHRYTSRFKVFKLLGERRTACMLLALGGILLAAEGTWSLPIHRTYPFLAYALLLQLSLSWVLLDAFRRKARPGFLLNHLGLFLILWASIFGSPTVSRSKMVIGKGDAVNFAYTAEGKVITLPFIVALDDFHIDYYPDQRSPRQFTSRLLVAGQPMSVSVNNPVTVQGYTLFQDSYDREGGQYTVLLLVRDPWLPVVYLGMLLLALGSVLLLFSHWRARFVVPVTLVLTVLFTAFSVSRINFGTLMPALRSWWFVPHLFIYMVAYSLMAIALLLALMATIRHHESWHRLSDNLVRSSSALLIIGMLSGSVWARQAWGDYWAWDPKENWAAATWFISLIYLHLSHKGGWKSLTVLFIAFLALQVTWYGVNYLPSANDSLHTYNRK